MHTRAKISVTFWLVATALAAILVLANKLRWYYELEVYQAAALGMLLVVAWRLWAVRRLRKQQELNAARRLQELQYEATQLGQPVRIEGMGPTLWMVLGVPVTALAIVMYLDTGKIIGLVFAALTATSVVIVALMRIARLGQPLLIVSREGVEPAGYGLLPWPAVYGIECHTPDHKHISGTMLNLYVPELKAHLDSAHPFIRFFHCIPGIRSAQYTDVITVRMRKPSELPGVIERLCRNLWQEATGRTHRWSIHVASAPQPLAEMIADSKRKLTEIPCSSERIEQLRTDIQNLQRHERRVDEQRRRTETWMRVWMVPGIFAVVLFAGQVPFGRLVAFVPTDEWSTQALVIAAVLMVMAWALIIGHARNVFGDSFTRIRLVQVLVTLSLTSILALPLTWFLITDIGGAMVAYGGNGPDEEITVIATKKERSTRRGCDYILSHPGLGKRHCLVREEFLSFPDQVPVVLSIRRNPLGYKVYEQRVVLPRRQESRRR